MDDSAKTGTSPTDIASFQRDLAYCYFRQKKYDEAWKLAGKASAALPDDPTVSLIMGSVLVDKKDYKNAFLRLAHGLEHDQDNQEFYLPMAKAAIESRVPAWARYGFSAAERAMMSHQDKETCLLAARGALAADHPGLAIRALAAYSGEKNGDALATYLTAIALERLGSDNQAKSVKARALKIDPQVATRVVIPDAPKRPNGLIPLSTTTSPEQATINGARPASPSLAKPPVSEAQSAPEKPTADTIPATDEKNTAIKTKPVSQEAATKKAPTPSSKPETSP